MLLLKDYIKVFDVNVEDWILKEIQSLENLFVDAVPGVTTNSTAEFKLLLLEKYTDIPVESFEKLFGTLHMGLVQTVDEYHKSIADFRFAQLNGAESFTLTNYKTNGFFKPRADYTPQKSRTLSIHLTLNDDYTGGEFSFFDGELIIPTKKNQIIVFPASFMFNYEMLPVKTGERWAAENWTK